MTCIYDQQVDNGIAAPGDGQAAEQATSGGSGQAEYPFEWETDAVAADGATVRLRPIKPTDLDRLAAFHGRQSAESIYFRYFRFRPELSATELEYFTTVDYDKRMAFVAIVGDELVAVARYESSESEDADSERPEVAFFVDDAHHGRGLATLMLEYLAAVARQKGLAGFSATVLPENYGMLHVFRKAGFEVSTKFSDGIIEVSLGIEITRATAAVIEARGRRAQARSVARIVEPQSVAVVGAGRSASSVGNRLAKSIADAPFAGPAWVVNPSAAADGVDLIAGIPIVAALDDIDVEVDLAVIAVPSNLTEEVVEACVKKHVHGMIIVSAGFSEESPEGSELESRIVGLARSNGMRLIGPGSFGVVNTDPAVNLEAVFVPFQMPNPGSVAVLSQSGPLGAALLDQMSRSGVGISSFVAVGNRADVSTNDLLQYWAADERTQAICLYQPNIGNPRNFSRIARHVSAIKPIIAVEPENASMIDLLRQSGVIVVSHVSELVEQAQMVVDQPPPLGNRVAIVSNASSAASLAAAACRREGLEVVVPSGVTGGRAADVVLIGDADTLAVPRRADPFDYEQIVVAAALSAEVDMILLAIVPTLTLSIEKLVEVLARVDRVVDKPMVATGLVDPSLLSVPGLPSFTFPEQAARVLGHMAEHARWRALHRGTPIEADAAFLDLVEDAVIDSLGDEDERVLTITDGDLPRLLGQLDLPIAPFRVVTDADEAVAAADELGYPVVLKAGGVSQRRSGEAGGTALDLRDGGDVVECFSRMNAAFDEAFSPAIVQTTVPTGSHLAVELLQDSLSGARLTIGIGGASARSIAAMAAVYLPASEVDLDRVLAEPWLVDLMPTAAAKFALRDLLARLAVAADASPELTSVRFNPVLLSNTDAVPVGAEVSLHRSTRDPLAEVRHL